MPFEQGDFDRLPERASRPCGTDVDAFFDKVLVNAEDRQVREARLGFLQKISDLMNVVADISKLSD